MEEVSSLWIVGTVATIVGGVIGLLIGRSSPAAQQKEALITELNDTRRELEQYKADVGLHFERTAELVNEMTASYRKVHQHLAGGADLLGGAVALKQLQPQPAGLEEQVTDEQAQTAQAIPAAEAPPESPIATADSDNDALDAPRDYAPKLSEEDGGTLAEGYGLQKKNTETGHDPSKTADRSPNHH